MRQLIHLAAGAVTLALAAGRGDAQGVARDSVPPATRMAREELVRMLDSTIDARMERHRLAGGAYALVRDGVLTARGFGVADITSREPVEAQRTVFGISSVSKTFTAAAVLQLVADGRLALDDPVAKHVPELKLREYDGRAVLVRHLLTHTGGFDDAGIGVSARRPEDVRPLAAYLTADMPPQVRPPGEVTAYSNHGYALAGLVVERAAGMPFARYVHDRVLAPLGMRSSSFAQPLPPELESARATPYAIRRREWRPVPRIWFNDAPASAMHTTAADMGLFMQAMLARDTLDPMLRRQFSNHPLVTGLTFGFRERRDGPVTAFDQGGDWQDYSSRLVIAPSLGVALFVAFNGEDGADAAEAMWQVVLGADSVPGAARPRSTGRGAAPLPYEPPPGLAGSYRVARHSRTTIARLGILTGAIQQLDIRDDGDRLVLGFMPLHPAGEDAFTRGRERTIVAFRRGGDGAASHMFLERSPYSAFERVAWYDDRNLHHALFAIALALLPLGIIAGLVTRRRRRTGTTALRVSSGAAMATEVLALALLLGIGAVLARTDPWEFQYGMPAVVQALVWLSPAVIALAIVAATATARVLARREGAIGDRTILVLRAATGLLTAALLLHWRITP